MSSKKLDGSHAESSSSSVTRCGFIWLVLLAEILLFGSMALLLFWVFYYYFGLHWEGENKYKTYNLHFVFMMGGFIFLNGQAILMYRLLPFCKKIISKLIHAFLFALSIVCIALGMLPVIRENSKHMHLFSIHSWIGVAAMGLYGLQFIVAFISYLLLLCCDSATAKFRQRLLPTHITFGIIIFNMAVAACVTGLAHTARARMSGTDNDPHYKDLPEQGIILNTIGIVLIALSVVLTYLIPNKSFKRYTTLTIN